MKKVFRFLTIAAFTLGTVSMFSCKDDDTTTTDNGEPEPEAVAVLIDEHFDGDVLPTDWTYIDADGDGYCWEVGFGPIQMAGVNESNCAVSASFFAQAGPLAPDNWMISPEIYIHSSGGYTLSWYDAAQDEEYANDCYSVYAGRLEDGEFVPIATLHTQELSSEEFTQRVVSLDQFKRQNIRIAFRHHDCTNEFYMKIDEVRVAKGGAKGPATVVATPGVKRK